MRCIAVALGALLLFLSLPASAHGHGSGWEREPQSIPPGLREPTDPAPPPEPPPDWIARWQAKRAEILAVKAVVKAHEELIASRSGGWSKRSLSETEKTIRDDLVPALEAAVGNEKLSIEVRREAVLALARCSGIRTDRFLRIALWDDVAILGLGIHQVKSPRIRDFLLAVAKDSKRPEAARRDALLSLGLLQDNDPAVFEHLRKRAKRDGAKYELLVMGLVGDEGWTSEVLRVLGRRQVGVIDRVHALAALGRIGDPRGLDAVFRAMEREDYFWPRRAAVIAAGEILPCIEPKERVVHLQRLAKHLEKEPDLSVRCHGRLALARAGTRWVDTETILTKAFRATSGPERSFAATALGLFARAVGPDPRLHPPEGVRHRIADLLRKDRFLLDGAVCIALGMLRDRRKETVDLLVEIAGDPKRTARLRGSACVALGMVRADGVSEAVRGILREEKDAVLLRDAGDASALLGDREAARLLAEELKDPEIEGCRLSVILPVLGWIGDRHAIAPLVDLLISAEHGWADIVRIQAAAALGHLADRRDVPVWARVTGGFREGVSLPCLR
jgi:HEAT repeat protein